MRLFAVHFLVAVFAFSSIAYARDMFLKSQEVIVEGVSDLQTEGNEAKARDAAIRNAQKNAIEQVLGSLIESSFTAEQKEQLKNGKSKFESFVQDNVHTKSQGYIEEQKLLKEKKDGRTYRVTMKIVVKAASLNQELAALQDLFKKAGYPKLMFVLNERYTNKNKRATWMDRPSALPVIENQLLELNFELVAKDQADKLRAQGLEVYNEVVGTPEKAAEIASEFGADVIITGTSEVTYTSYNDFGSNMYFVSAAINLQAIHASTAKILASFEAQGRGTGANEEQARILAVKQAGPKVTENLVTRLVQAWKHEVDAGKPFRIVVLRVRNYARMARPFIKAMKALPNVESVKELNFGGRRLELEVLYQGDKDNLLDDIFDRVANKKPFRRLNKKMDRGNTIEFSL